MYPLDLRNLEQQSSIKTVRKKWGKEIWLVNEPEYCAKLLCINKGSVSSYHHHKKKETFIPVEGKIGLVLEEKSHIMTEPVTIQSDEDHCFLGITDAVILEVSTHHNGRQVQRLTESKEQYGSN